MSSYDLAEQSGDKSTSQLIPNQGTTGANSGPKWRQILTFSKKLIKLLHFIQIENFFCRNLLGDI